DEGLGGGQVFRLVVLPKTAVSAEGGDSAFGGDAGAGQNRHAGCLRQPITSLFQVCQTYILVVAEPFRLPRRRPCRRSSKNAGTSTGMAGGTPALPVQELLQLLHLRLGFLQETSGLRDIAGV